MSKNTILPIEDAIELCNNILEDVNTFKNIKISDKDTGTVGWHIGKRELIILLAKIYDENPYTIQIKNT